VRTSSTTVPSSTSTSNTGSGVLGFLADKALGAHSGD
jgi:hypothetical protein